MFCCLLSFCPERGSGPSPETRGEKDKEDNLSCQKARVQFGLESVCLTEIVLECLTEHELQRFAFLWYLNCT